MTPDETRMQQRYLAFNRGADPRGLTADMPVTFDTEGAMSGIAKSAGNFAKAYADKRAEVLSRQQALADATMKHQNAMAEAAVALTVAGEQKIKENAAKAQADLSLGELKDVGNEIWYRGPNESDFKFLRKGAPSESRNYSFSNAGGDGGKPQAIPNSVLSHFRGNDALSEATPLMEGTGVSLVTSQDADGNTKVGISMKGVTTPKVFTAASKFQMDMENARKWAFAPDFQDTTARYIKDYSDRLAASKDPQEQKVYLAGLKFFMGYANENDQIRRLPVAQTLLMPTEGTPPPSTDGITEADIQKGMKLYPNYTRVQVIDALTH